MTDLDDAQAAISVPRVSVGPRRLNPSSGASNLLIVVDPHEFLRGCLTSWLAILGEEFEISGVADIRQLPRPDELTRASAVIFSVGAGVTAETWLEQQVGWLREQGSDVPAIAILESGAFGRGEELVDRLSLQGYIPTSSTPEVAKAALRLMFVGGSCPPRPRQQTSSLEGGGPNPAESTSPLARPLTRRETQVLELLMQGTANKVIAYRLGMSQNTVEVHVHNIIRKFNVSNRTEVAVTARDMRTPR